MAHEAQAANTTADVRTALIRRALARKVELSEEGRIAGKSEEETQLHRGYDGMMKKAATNQTPSASQRISDRIAELGGWRGRTLRKIRALIKEADPDVVEEWKWVKATNPGTPVWSHDGIICTGEAYKSAVKLTFAKGASLKDPAHLFNASLDGHVRRAIDIHEGEDIDASAFTALVREAISLNRSAKSKRSR
jgi:hypothetical protein